MFLESLPLEQTPLTPLLIKSYLKQDNNIKALYNYFPNPENFKKQAELKKSKYQHRDILNKVLDEQYQNLPKSETLKNNLESLQQENTFVITTAHQTNIFTGPLYYVYKILHAIKLAQSLQQKYPNYHFVPLYWMGSEDHDFEEINHFHLFGKKLEWQSDEVGSCGNFNPKPLLKLADEALQILQPAPHAQEIIQLFHQCYENFSTLASATQAIVNHLFGHYGLVVLNPNHKALKATFQKVFYAEIFQQAVSRYSQNALEKLNNLDFKIQAKPRDINLFYLNENGRNRILFEPKEKSFSVLNTALIFSENEMQQEVENFPERFSPNVFLRPLFQESLLPNIAYVGGSGELSYWLEQKNIFEHFDIPYPILQLRNSFLWIDANSKKKIEKLQIQAKDFLNDESDIIKKFVIDNSVLPDFSMEKNQLLNAFENLKAKAVNIDSTLSGTVEAQLQQVLNNLEQLEKKILKAEKQKQETAINQIKSLKQKFFPQQTFQERFENFLPYYAQIQNHFFEKILQQITPFDAQLHLMYFE